MALQEDRNIRRITIVGGGTTGCLTALHLTKTYPDKQITWIYPEDNDPIGVGEAIVPDVSNFLNNLGVSHDAIIRECNGSLKLGLRFENFNGNEDVFTFPFGGGVMDNKFNTTSIDHMMRTGNVPEDVFDYPDISTHFRAIDVLTFLNKTISKYSNITVERRTVTDKSELDGKYDLLIDATGFKRNLSYRPDNFLSLLDKIPNNTAFVFRHPYTDEKTQKMPYTTIRAMEYGWMWHIPLGDQLALGYVHDNKFDVKQEFIDFIKSKMGIDPDIAKIGTVKMITGRNKIHLAENVMAIGLASAFIEPLESTGLYLVTSSVRKLSRYLDGEITQDEYNEEVNKDFDAVVDFIIAHYKYSKRSNAYWDHYKNVDIVPYRPIDIFPQQSWDFILSGFLDDVKRPQEPLAPLELIKIQRSKPYYEWYKDAINITQIPD